MVDFVFSYNTYEDDSIYYLELRLLRHIHDKNHIDL